LGIFSSFRRLNDKIMAIGFWIKNSQKEENVYMPFSGEKSFNKDLLPIIIEANELVLLKNLSSGIVINCENVAEIILELRSLIEKLFLSCSISVEAYDFYHGRIKMIIEKLEEVSVAGFEEGYLG